MGAKNKFLPLLEKLLRKAENGKVLWTDATSSRSNIKFFAVKFGRNTEIALAADSPAGAPDWISAELTIDEETVYSLKAEEGEDEAFEMLKRLYNVAHESLYKWESKLQSLEDELDSDGDVGIPF